VNEITYHLEAADQNTFQWRYMWRLAESRPGLVFLGLVITWGSLDAAFRSDSPSWLIRLLFFVIFFAITAAVGGALILIVTWLIILINTRRVRASGQLGEHTIILTPEHVYERTEVTELRSLWRGVCRIEASRTHLFIFIKPTSAHIIPRRAFATPADADQFLATARSYLEASRQGPHPGAQNR
jgi:hypothetical protein